MGAGWEEVTRLRVEIRKWEVWYEREKEDGRDVPGGWRREGLLHRAERAVGMGGLLKREVDRRWEIEGVHRRLKRKAREWNKNRKELARRMVGFRGQVEELRERVRAHGGHAAVHAMEDDGCSGKGSVGSGGVERGGCADGG